MSDITLERASELVANATSSEDRADLFAHFDNYLNPYATCSEANTEWRIMFAEMCGYLLVEPIQST